MHFTDTENICMLYFTFVFNVSSYPYEDGLFIRTRFSDFIHNGKEGTFGKETLEYNCTPG